MNHRTVGFVSLLLVISASIVFGMLVGGRLNAPQVSFAAPLGSLAAPRSAPTTPYGSFADVVEAAMPAVVSVRSTVLPDSRTEGAQGDEPRFPGPQEWFRYWFGEPDEDPRERRRPDEPMRGEGTGFLISEDGYLLTNNHVIDQADAVRVRLNTGREFRAQVVGTDPSIDLALLKIDAQGERLPTLELGDSSKLRVGEWVIAIGNPQELEHTVTVGVVSAKERRVPIGSTDAGVASFLQTDAAINFGNSGGPLLDAQGTVIGINTAIRRMNLAEGIGFALPINHVRGVMEQLRAHGFVKRGYIGITMNPSGLDETAREWLGLEDSNGVIVDDVAADGPADDAGLRRGDVIRKVDDQPVKDNPDLIGKISSRQPGDKVHLEVYRKEGERGRTLEATVTLGDRQQGLQSNTEPQQGRPTRPRQEPEKPVEATALGITVRGLTAEDRKRLGVAGSDEGLVVVDVAYDSPAADKGLAAGMLVVSVNGKPVGSPDDWSRAIEGLRPGSPCKIDVRDGERVSSFYLRVPRPE